jgi:protein tyrosine/serine phosphatase
MPLSLLLYFGALQIAGNFDTVDAGRFYRSAQPSALELAGYAQALGLKSVINLRGAHPGEAWYDEEMAASQRLGLRHIDIALSARAELTPEELAAVETALREAPAPALVHCKGGADRSGLAAALYALEVQHLSPAAASGQLSWVYGHWPYFGAGTDAMDRTFARAVELRAGASR